MNDNAERIFAVASLARRYPDARILLSGGNGHLIGDHPVSESEYARRMQQAYPPSADGSTLLPFQRMFIVASLPV